MNSDDEIITSHMFDRIMERFDKLESLMDANDRRRLGKLRLPSHPKPPGRSDQGYSYQHPTRLRSCHEQPPGWPPPPLPPQRSTPAGWPTQRRLHAYEKLPPQRPPYFGRDSQAQQQRSDPYRHQQTTHSNGQPWQKDRPFLQRSPSCNRPPTYLRQTEACLDQPTAVQQPLLQRPPSYRPPRSPTCWESPEYVPPISLGCPPPHAAESRRLSRPYLRHDPFSPSLPIVAAVPPPPPQRSSSCLSMTSHCRSAAPLLAVAALPSSNLAPPAPACSPNDDRGEESRLLDEPPPPAAITPPCSPYISEEEETLLGDEEEVDSIEEVKTVGASLDAAKITSQDFVENCLDENGGALLRKFSKDSLYVNARKFTFDSMFDDKSGDLLGPTQWEFEIKDGVRNGSAFARIQRPCTFVFDPGGDTSPKLLLSTLRCFVVSTLRTRWILTVGELLRAFYLVSLDILGF